MELLNAYIDTKQESVRVVFDLEEQAPEMAGLVLIAAPARVGGMPVLGITGTHDTTVPPGAWENTHFTTSSDGSVYYYTGAAAMMRRWGNANGCPYSGKPAAAFNTRIPQADCRTYCSGSAQGWSGGSAGVGWPKVLDCRAATGHDYEFSWSWKLILDFFDAQSS